jgi:hypothetical protein
MNTAHPVSAIAAETIVIKAAFLPLDRINMLSARNRKVVNVKPSLSMSKT